MKYIDVTPKWADVIEIYLEALYVPPDSKGRASALSEIRRMAKIADERNEFAKQLQAIESKEQE